MSARPISVLGSDAFRFAAGSRIVIGPRHVGHMRVSTVRPPVYGTVFLWREPWWSRALAWAIAAYFAVAGR